MVIGWMIMYCLWPLLRIIKCSLGILGILILQHVKNRPLAKQKKTFAQEIKLEYWLQYEFLNQWLALKRYANAKGIRVIGDIPIFVDHNSADVWANTKYFAVDKKGNRTLVAGVPPDYFSETGQLWGNPQYQWGALEKDGYSWWVKRFKHMFLTCDAIRVDHFRGFDAYWEIPAIEKTAVNGRWVTGPGEKLFDTILKECGELPILAEDLGFVTEGVERLRDKYAFPGMKIIQFAFDADSSNSFLPHNYPRIVWFIAALMITTPRKGGMNKLPNMNVILPVPTLNPMVRI